MDEPITRKETYLAAIAGEDVEVLEPVTREEVYLKAILDNGGGGGKASINGVPLDGDLTTAQIIPLGDGLGINEDGELYATGDIKVKLGDVQGASATASGNSVMLKFSDPADVTLGGTVVAEWAGTKVVRKIGSAPQDMDDGVLVMDNKTRNAYSETGYVDSGLDYETTYYYRFFPYTDDFMTDGSSVSVEIGMQLYSWTNGTDEQIATMIAMADRGEIDLYADAGWRVGDEREVSLSAMTASGAYDGVSWTVGETHVAQTVTLVLMDAGKTSETGSKLDDTAASAYQLVSSVKNKDGSTRTNPSFIVGMKNFLANGTTREGGYMNSSGTNTNSWNGSMRKSWCNGAFRQALPSGLRGIFKQFNTITAQTYNGSTNQTSQDYFALPAEHEVFDTRTYSNQTEFNALKQFSYYATSANRIKKAGASGSAYYWWERSPYYNDSISFCCVRSGGIAGNSNASDAYGLSPFGCI